MFIAAVYYFAGMAKLTPEEQVSYISDFNKPESRETIKKFFEEFDKKTGNRYKSELGKISSSTTYEEMAKNFKELLDKIKASNDIEGLVCYCDSEDPMDDRFFIAQIIQKELKEKCGFSEASYRVVSKLKDMGVSTQYAFKNIELHDVLKTDILRLNAFDLAAMGYASSKTMENKPAVLLHLNLFESLVYYKNGQEWNRLKEDGNRNAANRILFLVDRLQLGVIKRLQAVQSLIGLQHHSIIKSGPGTFKTYSYGASAALTACTIGFYVYAPAYTLLKSLENIDVIDINDIIKIVLLVSLNKNSHNNDRSDIIYKMELIDRILAVIPSLACAAFAWQYYYRCYTDEALMLPPKADLFYSIIRVLEMEISERIEGWVSYAGLKRCIIIGSQAIFARATYNAATKIVDEWLCKSSVNVHIALGVVACGAVVSSVLSVAEEYIYKYRNASRIAAETKSREKELIEQIALS